MAPVEVGSAKVLEESVREIVPIFSIWYLRQAVRDAKRVAHSRLENAPVTSFGIPRPAKLPLPVPVLHPPSRGRDIGVTGLKKEKEAEKSKDRKGTKFWETQKGGWSFFEAFGAIDGNILDSLALDAAEELSSENQYGSKLIEVSQI
ncbi:hypothetical protein WUBG_08392 [Wuchereria bancrofti]|uniref:Uncharacterized protein n=1 Tax=Wuchereria bancrofti TaxID=6293 RepID=J9B1E1_WUCBA|nr:hypothetical protein WUBG_08392 [Wuchereria bancrofti]